MSSGLNCSGVEIQVTLAFLVVESHCLFFGSLCSGLKYASFVRV